jgi:hypothetical protein
MTGQDRTGDRIQAYWSLEEHLRSVLIILDGLALLGLLALFSTRFGGDLSLVTAAQTFIPMPVFVVTFAVPSAAAAFV